MMNGMTHAVIHNKWDVACGVELVPFRSVNCHDEIPCGIAKGVELWKGVGIATHKVSLPDVCGSAVEGLDNVGHVMAKELFCAKTGHSSEVAIP